MNQILLNLLNIGIPMAISIGALQGLIVSGILGFSERYKFKSVHFFALLLLTISITNIYGVFDLIKVAQQPLFEDYIPYFWYNLIPPSVYFFITYLVNPNYSFKNHDYLLFLPLILNAMYECGHFVQFLINGPYTLSDFQRFNHMGNIFELFASILSVIVFALSINRIVRHNQRLKKCYSNVEKINLDWAKWFLIIGLIISTAWVLVSFLNVYSGYFLKPLAIIIWLSVSLLIYWTAFSMLKKRELFEFSARNSLLNHQEFAKITKAQLTDAEIDYIQKQLETKVLRDKMFLNPTLTLRDLSNSIETSDKKLSIYLSEIMDTNFYGFINRLRIQEFKDKMEHEELLTIFSITGIAQQSGFNSKSSFYRAFKKYEKLTPSEFLKKIAKDKSQ